MIYKQIPMCTAHWRSQNSLVKFMKTVSDTAIVLNNCPKSIDFLQTQKFQYFRHFLPMPAHKQFTNCEQINYFSSAIDEFFFVLTSYVSFIYK